ncbi:MAG TPA: LytTR family DNA-binding domain-containing protein [Terriglobia bacterium]|nr:LytTR family DNA-binding domain-containing protein [Terriglobia bacterium]
MKITAVIVDDEVLARRSILRFLAGRPDVEVVAECSDGGSAVSSILAKRPELVFLDVQMPEMDGFEVLRKIGPGFMPVTIFVTAYDRYALRAFEVNALDYLLKPFGRERFEQALARARQRIAEKSDRNTTQRLISLLEGLNKQNEFIDRLPVTENGRILFLATREIDWIEANGNYVLVHAGARTYEIRETLTCLEQKLSPRDFQRIHRSSLVNVNRIKEIHPWFHGYHLVVLANGEKLRMSRYQTITAQRLGVGISRRTPETR